MSISSLETGRVYKSIAEAGRHEYVTVSTKNAHVHRWLKSSNRFEFVDLDPEARISE